MADVSTPSAIAMSTMDAGAEPSQTASSRPAEKPEKPEKPDEAGFREAEGKLKKDFELAQKKTVSFTSSRNNVP